MTYREARSLITLQNEINKAAPGRSRASDGWIGDARHQAGWDASDHNPWLDGVVRARDWTDDPGDGMDGDRLAAFLAALMRKKSHPALGPGAYIIWDRQIFSYNRMSEGWRPYTGRNAHTKHVHLSVATSRAGYDSTKAWGVAGALADIASPQKAATRAAGPDTREGVDRWIQGELDLIERPNDTALKTRVMGWRREMPVKALDQVRVDMLRERTAWAEKGGQDAVRGINRAVKIIDSLKHKKAVGQA